MLILKLIILFFSLNLSRTKYYKKDIENHCRAFE